MFPEDEMNVFEAPPRDPPLYRLVDQLLTDQNDTMPVQMVEILTTVGSLLLHCREAWPKDELWALVSHILRRNEIMLDVGMDLSVGDTTVPFLTAEQREADPERAVMTDEAVQLALGAYDIPDFLPE